LCSRGGPIVQRETKIKFCSRRRRAAFFFWLSVFALTCLPQPGISRINARQSLAVNGLAPAPPMAWAGWNHSLCDLTKKTIRQPADALVPAGMREAGYRHVIRQECTAPEPEATANLVIDGARFPRGMPAPIAVGDVEFGDRPTLCFL
jgi:hypothetical protein